MNRLRRCPQPQAFEICFDICFEICFEICRYRVVCAFSESYREAEASDPMEITQKCQTSRPLSLARIINVHKNNRKKSASLSIFSYEADGVKQTNQKITYVCHFSDRRMELNKMTKILDFDGIAKTLLLQISNRWIKWLND